jgi:hypothetical protein
MSQDPTTAERAGYDNNGTVVERQFGGDSIERSYEFGEIYVYNYDANRVTCASCDPSGARPVTDANFETRADEYAVNVNVQYLSHALSEDGGRLFFDTGDALVPQDTNGKRDVYEFDRGTAQVHLISSGVCNCNSFFVDASADGHDVFFTTHQRLVRIDVDDNSDLYDARIEGGIASQNEMSREPCEGDDCQGPAKPVHVFSVPASSTFNGVGNTPPSVEVKKESVSKKKGKHAKKKKGKHRRHRSKKGGKMGKHASRRAGR